MLSSKATCMVHLPLSQKPMISVFSSFNILFLKVRHIVTVNFAATIYLLLCKISLKRSLTRMISWRDITKIVLNISLIYCFNIWQSMRCFADISAINCENKARYSSNIVCINFAQYCRRLILSLPFQIK